jgi:hypothetical protein
MRVNANVNRYRAGTSFKSQQTPRMSSSSALAGSVDGKWLAGGTTEQLRKFEAANPLGPLGLAVQSPWCWIRGSTFPGA